MWDHNIHAHVKDKYPKKQVSNNADMAHRLRYELYGPLITLTGLNSQHVSDFLLKIS